jgi:hypothetical protein
MNLGFQDATSLAWRLAMVANGSSLCKGAVERILESYSRERRSAAQAMNDNVQAQIALMTASNPPEVALRDAFKEALKNPELNTMWARRMTGFGDPTEAYIYPSLETKGGASKVNSSSDGSQGDLFVGMRVTSRICGSGMEDLFRVTTLENFVLLQGIGGAEIKNTGLETVLKTWKDRVTVRSPANEHRGKSGQNIDALLVRPDMRIAWVTKSELPIAEIHSSYEIEFDRKPLWLSDCNCIESTPVNSYLRISTSDIVHDTSLKLQRSWMWRLSGCCRLALQFTFYRGHCLSQLQGYEASKPSWENPGLR